MRKALWWITENSTAVGLAIFAAAVVCILGHAVWAATHHAVSRLPPFAH